MVSSGRQASRVRESMPPLRSRPTDSQSPLIRAHALCRAAASLSAFSSKSSAPLRYENLHSQ